MRFYRMHRRHDAGASAGFEFFGDKKSADKASREWLKENPDESADVEPIDVKPTKTGILAALNRWADHPDNG